jgi:capsular polysaccharide transport system ATP-binding protein
MIELQNVSKRYRVHSGERTVLSDVNFSIARGQRWGILGRNGAGKSTLIRLISGAERPTTGRVVRDMSVSWPLAFGGAFQGSLTGRDNVRFISRVYGIDFERAIDFVASFSELGVYLREPVKKYSSGMRQRLAFAISMAVEFDCFLIDEVVSVGDSRFHEKCHSELFDKRGDRAMIIVSHVVDYVRERCDKAALLVDGELKLYDDVEEAIDVYQHL